MLEIILSKKNQKTSLARCFSFGTMHIQPFQETFAVLRVPLNVLCISGLPDFRRINEVHRPHDYPVEVGDMLNISVYILNHFQNF